MLRRNDGEDKTTTKGIAQPLRERSRSTSASPAPASRVGGSSAIVQMGVAEWRRYLGRHVTWCLAPLRWTGDFSPIGTPTRARFSAGSGRIRTGFETAGPAPGPLAWLACLALARGAS
jgi:hypothetical protein